jgi:hypothetical protein
VVADLSARLDQAVAEGRVDAERAETAKERVPERVSRLVEAHKGDLRAEHGG